MALELIPHPLALPGCCFRCRTGSENREWFIDLGFSMDDFGAVIICNECVTEMGYAAGMMSKDHSETLTEENRLLRIELAAISIRAEGLEQAIDGLRLAGSGTREYSEPTFPLDLVEVAAIAESESREREEIVADGEGSTPESLHDEGMAIIPDDAGSGEFSLNI